MTKYQRSHLAVSSVRQLFRDRFVAPNHSRPLTCFFLKFTILIGENEPTWPDQPGHKIIYMLVTFKISNPKLYDFESKNLKMLSNFHKTHPGQTWPTTGSPRMYNKMYLLFRYIEKLLYLLWASRDQRTPPPNDFITCILKWSICPSGPC